jgi:hypothetical protein
MDPALAWRNLRKLREEQRQIDRPKSRLTLLEPFAQPPCVTLFAVTTFNSLQPLPDCNMNKLVFVPPLASHPLVGYKHEGAKP